MPDNVIGKSVRGTTKGVEEVWDKFTIHTSKLWKQFGEDPSKFSSELVNAYGPDILASLLPQTLRAVGMPSEFVNTASALLLARSGSKLLGSRSKAFNRLTEAGFKTAKKQITSAARSKPQTPEMKALIAKFSGKTPPLKDQLKALQEASEVGILPEGNWVSYMKKVHDPNWK